MKTYLCLIGLITLSLFGFSTNAYACTLNAEITTGPEGRCATTPGIPVTYTGTHDLSTNACISYEWTIEGGTMTGPTGVFVPDGGTLCVDGGCGDCLLTPGVAPDFQPSVQGGTGTVDVIWNQGVKGKLKLKVKFKVKVKVNGSEVSVPITSTDEIEVDFSLPEVTSLSTSANGPNSTTFTANLDKTLCAGQTIEWTLNGNPAGTGATKTFSVGSCASGVVCAFTSQQIGPGPVFFTETTTPKCRSFTGGNLNAYVSGPANASLNSFFDYILVSNQPIASATWSASPSTGVNFIGGTTGSSVLATFVAQGNYDICVSGTTTCGTSFTRCLTVTVGSGIGDGDGFRTTKGNAGEVSSDAEQPSTLEKGVMAPIGGSPLEQQLQLQPNLVQAGQKISINLPLELEKAQLSIQDVYGNQVRQKAVRDGDFTFSTAGLRPGMYIVTVQSQQWQGSKRFVVQQ